jgi:hypothetical protein
MSEHPDPFTMYEGRVARFQLPEAPSAPFFKTQFTDGLDYLIRSREPFSLIIDSSRVNTISPEITNNMVRWLKQNRENLQQSLKSSSVIVTSGVVKGVLDVVFKLYKPVSPIGIVKDDSAAWEFISKHE